MKYDKIFYQRLFPTGPYSNEKLGIELIIEPGETAEQGLTAAKMIIEKWHRDHHPELYVDHPAPEIQPEKSQAPDKRTNSLIDDIRSCKELKVLESYRILAKTKPEFQAAYDEMIEKLTPKQ